ncbi:armadillo repeat-containing protein 1-like [Poecilia reticulata]|uniref:armadillo repeat-containing protein 1-like n=1 Tax=Poecilia reticulata TaxID=8081 RepID=UPI0007E9BA24|nr:PREDICTED: armadillo repeat-containing protein 1-like [Poecilia reticulata]
MLPRGSAAGLSRKNRRFGWKRENKPKTQKFRRGPRKQNGNRTSGGGPDRTGPDRSAGSGTGDRYSQVPPAAMSGEPDPLVARPDPVPDPLAVVTQLRDLAADPMNRRAIVQDHGCLPGLILFLDHPDPQVVYCALLAVRYLAECRANREKLKAELGMMLSLQNIVQKSTTFVLQVLVHFPEAGSVSVEQNLDLPEYLPEEESPSQDPDKAISRVGSGQDGSSWLGAAANFLSRSFYW